jgi:hypothetical protein
VDNKGDDMGNKLISKKTTLFLIWVSLIILLIMLNNINSDKSFCTDHFRASRFISFSMSSL